jgi:hypothetical protein
MPLIATWIKRAVVMVVVVSQQPHSRFLSTASRGPFRGEKLLKNFLQIGKDDFKYGLRGQHARHEQSLADLSKLFVEAGQLWTAVLKVIRQSYFL